MPKELDYLIFECDMNSGGTFRMFKQDDGDIILSISTEESHAHVEICAPFTGGKVGSGGGMYNKHFDKCKFRKDK